ncbi:MAG: 30S ribosomal protein S6 [Chloroflexi bacterium]|nr:MAG: 30S ribosomal protein S6 [Chloroflexota bacterium]
MLMGANPREGDNPYIMNREYELAVVFRVDPNEQVINEAIDEVKAWVEENEQSKVTNIDRWGRRRLAYQIKKQREGYYVFYTIEGSPSFLPELERNLKISEKVLRYLVVRKDS